MNNNPIGNKRVYEAITMVVIIVYLAFIFIKFLYL
jgi:hypothetical protein